MLVAGAKVLVDGAIMLVVLAKMFVSVTSRIQRGCVCSMNHYKLSNSGIDSNSFRIMMKDGSPCMGDICVSSINRFCTSVALDHSWPN
jgi:hypothetical protein